MPHVVRKADATIPGISVDDVVFETPDPSPDDSSSGERSEDLIEMSEITPRSTAGSKPLLVPKAEQATEPGDTTGSTMHFFHGTSSVPQTPVAVTPRPVTPPGSIKKVKKDSQERRELGTIRSFLCKMSLVGGVGPIFVPDTKIEPSIVALVYLLAFFWLQVESAKRWAGTRVPIPPRSFWLGISIFSISYIILYCIFGALVHQEIITLTEDSWSEVVLRYVGFQSQIWQADNVLIRDALLTFVPSTIIFFLFIFVQRLLGQDQQELTGTSQRTFACSQDFDGLFEPHSDSEWYANRARFGDGMEPEIQTEQDPERIKQNLKMLEWLKLKYVGYSMFCNFSLAVCNPCLLTLPNICFLFSFLNFFYLLEDANPGVHLLVSPRGRARPASGTAPDAPAKHPIATQVETILWSVMSAYSMVQLLALSAFQVSAVDDWMSATQLPDGTNDASNRNQTEQLMKAIGLSSFEYLGSEWIGIFANASQLFLILITFILLEETKHVRAAVSKFRSLHPNIQHDMGDMPDEESEHQDQEELIAAAIEESMKIHESEDEEQDSEWSLRIWRFLAPNLLSTGLGLWSLCYPSIFGIVLMISAFAVIHLNSSICAHPGIAVCVSVGCSVYIMMQYIANVLYWSGLVKSTIWLNKIGLLEHDIPWIHFGIQIAILVFLIMPFTKFAPTILTNQKADHDAFERGNRVGFPEAVKIFIMIFSSTYIFCLTATYCIGVLQRPNILNAGYMIIAVVFACQPKLIDKPRNWRVLVAYIQLVFSINYMIQFFEFDQNKSYAQLFGFKHWSLQWHEDDHDHGDTSKWILLPDLLVLVISAVQLSFFEKNFKIKDLRGNLHNWFGDLSKLLYQHGVTMSLTIIHLFVFCWMLYDALTQTQSYTSIWGLLVWFLAVHSLQNRGCLQRKTIDEPKPDEDEADQVMQHSDSLMAAVKAEKTMNMTRRSRFFHEKVATVFTASLITTGVVVLALFVAVLEWSVPDFMMNFLGNPSHDSTEWTWFIYSQTILFLALVTRARVRAMFGKTQGEIDEEWHEAQKLAAQNEEEQTKDLKRLSSTRKGTGYAHWKDSGKAGERQAGRDSMSGAVSALTSFMRALYNFVVRIIALHGRPLLSVYIFANCISYSSIVTHLIGTYAILDLILIQPFKDQVPEKDDDDFDIDITIDDKYLTSNKCTDWSRWATEEKFISSNICTVHGTNVEKLSCPGCDGKSGAWAKHLYHQFLHGKSQKSNDYRSHLVNQGHTLSLIPLYVLVEVFVLWLYFYQFEWTRDYSMVWDWGKLIESSEGVQTDITRQDALDWFGFRLFSEADKGYDSIMFELLPWVMIPLLGVICSLAPTMALSMVTRKPQYERDGYSSPCTLFGTSNSRSTHRTSLSMFQDLYLTHGRAICCCILVFAASAKGTIASVPYIFMVAWIALRDLKVVTRWIHLALKIMAFYILVQFWTYISLEYPKLKSTPWNDLATDYQEWFGLQLNDPDSLILDVVALYVCSQWYSAIALLTDQHSGNWKAKLKRNNKQMRLSMEVKDKEVSDKVTQELDDNFMSTDILKLMFHSIYRKTHRDQTSQDTGPKLYQRGLSAAGTAYEARHHMRQAETEWVNSKKEKAQAVMGLNAIKEGLKKIDEGSDPREPKDKNYVANFRLPICCMHKISQLSFDLTYDKAVHKDHHGQFDEMRNLDEADQAAVLEYCLIKMMPGKEKSVNKATMEILLAMNPHKNGRNIALKAAEKKQEDAQKQMELAEIKFLKACPLAQGATLAVMTQKSRQEQFMLMKHEIAAAKFAASTASERDMKLQDMSKAEKHNIATAISRHDVLKLSAEQHAKILQGIDDEDLPATLELLSSCYTCLKERTDQQALAKEEQMKANNDPEYKATMPTKPNPNKVMVKEPRSFKIVSAPVFQDRAKAYFTLCRDQVVAICDAQYVLEKMGINTPTPGYHGTLERFEVIKEMPEVTALRKTDVDFNAKMETYEKTLKIRSRWFPEFRTLAHEDLLNGVNDDDQQPNSDSFDRVAKLEALFNDVEAANLAALGEKDRWEQYKIKFESCSSSELSDLVSRVLCLMPTKTKLEEYGKLIEYFPDPEEDQEKRRGRNSEIVANAVVKMCINAIEQEALTGEGAASCHMRRSRLISGERLETLSEIPEAVVKARVHYEIAGMTTFEACYETNEEGDFVDDGRLLRFKTEVCKDKTYLEYIRKELPEKYALDDGDLKETQKKLIECRQIDREALLAKEQGECAKLLTEMSRRDREEVLGIFHTDPILDAKGKKISRDEWIDMYGKHSQKEFEKMDVDGDGEIACDVWIPPHKVAIDEIEESMHEQRNNSMKYMINLARSMHKGMVWSDKATSLLAMLPEDCAHELKNMSKSEKERVLRPMSPAERAKVDDFEADNFQSLQAFPSPYFFDEDHPSHGEFTVSDLKTHLIQVATNPAIRLFDRWQLDPQERKSVEHYLLEFLNTMPIKSIIAKGDQPKDNLEMLLRSQSGTNMMDADDIDVLERETSCCGTASALDYGKVEHDESNEDMESKDKLTLTYEGFRKLMWSFYKENYITPTKLEKMLRADFQFRLYICLNFPHHCMVVILVLAMLDVSVLNLGYMLFIAYYFYNRQKLMWAPGTWWALLRVWNVMGLLLVFLTDAPFWDSAADSPLSASGNFVLDNQSCWFIQPLMFGILALQSEAYQLDQYLETLVFDKFQSRMHKIVFRRQMIHEVNAWGKMAIKKQVENQQLKDYIDQVKEYFSQNINVEAHASQSGATNKSLSERSKQFNVERKANRKAKLLLRHDQFVKQVTDELNKQAKQNPNQEEAKLQLARQLRENLEVQKDSDLLQKRFNISENKRAGKKILTEAFSRKQPAQPSTITSTTMPMSKELEMTEINSHTLLTGAQQILDEMVVKEEAKAKILENAKMDQVSRSRSGSVTGRSRSESMTKLDDGDLSPLSRGRSNSINLINAAQRTPSPGASPRSVAQAPTSGAQTPTGRSKKPEKKKSKCAKLVSHCCAGITKMLSWIASLFCSSVAIVVTRTVEQTSGERDKKSADFTVVKESEIEAEFNNLMHHVDGVEGETSQKFTFLPGFPISVTEFKALLRYWSEIHGIDVNKLMKVAVVRLTSGEDYCEEAGAQYTVESSILGNLDFRDSEDMYNIDIAHGSAEIDEDLMRELLDAQLSVVQHVTPLSDQRRDRASKTSGHKGLRQSSVSGSAGEYDEPALSEQGDEDGEGLGRLDDRRQLDWSTLRLLVRYKVLTDRNIPFGTKPYTATHRFLSLIKIISKRLTELIDEHQELIRTKATADIAAHRNSDFKSCVKDVNKSVRSFKKTLCSWADTSQEFKEVHHTELSEFGKANPDIAVCADQMAEFSQNSESSDDPIFQRLQAVAFDMLTKEGAESLLDVLRARREVSKATNDHHQQKEQQQKEQQLISISQDVAWHRQEQELFFAAMETFEDVTSGLRGEPLILHTQEREKLISHFEEQIKLDCKERRDSVDTFKNACAELANSQLKLQGKQTDKQIQKFKFDTGKSDTDQEYPNGQTSEAWRELDMLSNLYTGVQLFMIQFFKDGYLMAEARNLLGPLEVLQKVITTCQKLPSTTICTPDCVQNKLTHDGAEQEELPNCDKFNVHLSGLLIDLEIGIQHFIPRVQACGLLYLSQGLENLAQADPLMKEKKHCHQSNKMGSQLQCMPSNTRTLTMLSFFFNCFVRFYLNYSAFTTHILCFVAHAVSGSLSSMVYPVATFSVGLLIRPYPSKNYWYFLMIYSMFIIICKYTVSLRAFCDSDVVYETGDDCDITLDLKVNYMEWPYVLGIKPGHSGYGFVWSISWDLLILFSAVNCRTHLRSTGRWSRDPRKMLNKLKDKADLYKKAERQRDDEVAKRFDFYKEYCQFAPDFEGLIRRQQRFFRENLEDQSWVKKVLTEEEKGEEEKRRAKTGAQFVESPCAGTEKQLMRVKADPIFCDNESKLMCGIGSVLNAIKHDDNVGEAYQNHYFAEDLYSTMLFYRFVGMLWVAVFYPTFSVDSIEKYRSDASFTGIQTVITMKVIEIDYLAFLVVLFIHAVVDHVIFLLGNMKAKWILQTISVILLHLCMLVTFKMQADAPSIRVFILGCYYVIECGYLYNAARQIQVHFPADTQKDAFFTQHEHVKQPKSASGKYGNNELVHSIELTPSRTIYYAWSVVSLIPFAWELRCILDWWFCDTTLDLIEFIRLYDLHGAIFSVAYLRHLENTGDIRYVGMLQFDWYKWLAGGLSFVGLCLVIWGPLFIFSGASPFLQENPILFASLDVFLASSHTEFLFFSQRSYNIKEVTNEMIRDLDRQYLPVGKPNQVNQYVTFTNVSNSNYAVPYGLFQATFSSGSGNFSKIRAVWHFSREYPVGLEDIIVKDSILLNSSAQESLYDAFTNSVNNPNTNNIWNFDLGHVYPDALSCSRKECIVETNYRHQMRGSVTTSTDGTSYYSLSIAYQKGAFETIPGEHSDQNYLNNIVTSEGVATGIFADDSFSLGGLYITVVFVIGNILRSAMKGISQKIMITEMEDVRVPVFLCSAITKARRIGNFYVEHELYLHLIELFRRPEKLWELTTKQDGTMDDERGEPEPRHNGPWINSNLLTITDNTKRDARLKELKTRHELQQNTASAKKLKQS